MGSFFSRGDRPSLFSSLLGWFRQRSERPSRTTQSRKRPSPASPGRANIAWEREQFGPNLSTVKVNRGKTVIGKRRYKDNNGEGLGLTEREELAKIRIPSNRPRNTSLAVSPVSTRSGSSTRRSGSSRRFITPISPLSLESLSPNSPRSGSSTRKSH
jgi:hypothetical protein